MAAKPKMPVKTVTAGLDDEGYPGFEVDVRTNAPPRLIKRYFGLNTKSPESEAEEILLQLFPGWRLYDDEGKRIPHSAAGFESIPGDLVAAMLKVRTQVIQKGAMPAPLGSGSSTKGSPDTMASPMTEETTEG
jgi:hypothetical protein